MLNTTGDDAFNKLIRNVRKINVYLSEDGALNSRDTYRQMISGLSDEDFETLVNIKSEELMLNLMGRESGSKAYYVLAVSEGQMVGVLEMDGKLDLRYLQAIESVNFDKLREIVGQDKKTENSENGEDH
jgi:hypothetical protein